MKSSSVLEEEIFLEGLSVPSAQRKNFVDSRCGQDSALAERVNALIRGYEENSAYLEKPPASGARSGSSWDGATSQDHIPGDRIGPYRLVERLGEGGCGIVYLAEQVEPVQRPVALKVIKLGLDTREFVARFEAERQALAMMNHANIARVFDAGATPEGRPYFAMELVRGPPVTRYCDEHKLTLTERLELFVTVCHAVQHAHQKGVIHRDLKPSNILVGADDGRPVPKIIDFGIAKTLHPPSNGLRLTTHANAFFGTPAYTSPEQMEGGPSDLDTRSDVYSLGVVLYELLTGQQPFPPDSWARASLDETRRMIGDVELPRPSSRVNALPLQQRATAAAHRRIEPTRMAALLQEDLDWIVMRCLEKERTRRYETVNALAMDLRRYLEGEPVLARSPSQTYRIGKFIRRHRTGVVAASTIAASVIAGLITAGILLARETAARDRAERAERAESALRRQAEDVGKNEIRRATRAVIDLANERLIAGRAADGVGFLAEAARRDPANPHVGPLLASVLTARNFMMPTAPLARHDAPVLGMEFSSDGSHLLTVWEDGAYGWINLADGTVESRTIPGPRLGYTRMPTRKYLLLYSPDGVIRSLDRDTGQITREIHFEFDAMGCRAVDDVSDLFSTKLTSNMMMVGDASTGRTVGAPVPYDGFFGAGPKWVAWSPDGTGTPTKSVRFRRTDGDNEEVTVTFPVEMAHGKLATSPDGRRLATVQREEPNGDYFLRIWSLPDGASIAKSQRLERGAYAFYSPDSRFVFCWGQGLEMFDADTAERVNRMPSAGTFVDDTRCVFSPDRRLLATWGVSDTVDVWDVASGGSRLASVRHGGAVNRVAFSRDGKVMMTSSDRFARVWDSTTGGLLGEPSLHFQAAPAVALSPDGAVMMVGTSEGAVFRFSVEQRGARSLDLPRVGELPAVFLPGSPTSVLCVTEKRGHILDLASGKWRGPGIEFPESIRRASVRADGKIMVVQTAAGRWQAWWLEAERIKRVVEIADDSAEIAAIVFSPANDLMALSRADHLRVWNLTTGRPASPPMRTWVNYNFARYASFSPDGARILVGSNQGRARVWNVATGREEIDFGLQPTRLLTTAFSPDGTRIVGGSRIGRVQLYNAADGRPIGNEVTHRGLNGEGVFSPDGRWVSAFANDQQMHLLEVGANGAVRQTIETDGALRSVRFAPDSNRVVTATYEGTAQVWDAQSGLPVTESLQHGTVRVNFAEFSPDGKFLRTETAPDGKFHFWSVPPALPTNLATPSWLIELAELCAGRPTNVEDNATGREEGTAKVERLRETIGKLNDDDPYAAWGRWMIADRSTRSIAPGFSISPADAARLAEQVSR